MGIARSRDESAGIGDLLQCLEFEPPGISARPSAAMALKLSRDERAPAIARAAMRGLCESIGIGGPKQETLLLLVSEVVTNAVVHSGAPADTQIRFTADAAQGRIHVAVDDGGPGFPEAPADRLRRRGGWGIRLLEREAADWGVRRGPGTIVWFELEFDETARLRPTPTRVPDIRSGRPGRFVRRV